MTAAHRGGTRRPAALQPVAITPTTAGDIVGAAADHFRGRGREQLRRQVTEYLGAADAATYTSFVRSLYACLETIKRREDAGDGSAGEADAVVLPRYSCPDFAHAIDAAGLTRRYCDVDPGTLSIDEASLRSLETDDAVALFAVNHFGLSNPMDRLVDFCADRDLYLIEDLGYSLGAEYRGTRLGGFGDFGVLNFREGKAIPVPGGMVTTRREDVDLGGHADRDGGIGGSDGAGASPGVDGDGERPAARPAVHVALGYRALSHPTPYRALDALSGLVGTDVRKRASMEDTTRRATSEFDNDFEPTPPLPAMSHFDAALGSRVFDRLERVRRGRNATARYYRDALADCDGVQPVRPLPETRPHFIRYPVLVHAGHRADLVDRLDAVGIEASTVYHDDGMRVDETAYPGSARVCRELVTLPTHPRLDDDDRAAVVEAVRSHLG